MDSVILMRLEEAITLAKNTINKLYNFEVFNVEGLSKLLLLVKKELTFLETLTSDTVKDIHLRSTNLHQFSALVDQIGKQRYIVAVLAPFRLQSSDPEGALGKPLSVDIVCDRGQTWMKVIARNPLSMTLVSQGNCSFGKRSIIDQAKEFLLAASQHKHEYQAPKVIFYFAAGIQADLADTLAGLGIVVRGTFLEVPRSSVHYDDSPDSPDEAEQGERVAGNGEAAAQEGGAAAQEGGAAGGAGDAKGGAACGNAEVAAWKGGACPRLGKAAPGVTLPFSVIDTANLDVTAMVGYVSALTNGSVDIEFNLDLLNMQRDNEIETPLKPILDKQFEGKRLICCQSAANAFTAIVNSLGGRMEKRRAHVLMQRVAVVADTGRPLTLALNHKIKSRSAIVFMTGEDHHAVTISANQGFVRSALNQNHRYTVFLHESRALTEAKETTLGMIGVGATGGAANRSKDGPWTKKPHTSCKLTKQVYTGDNSSTAAGPVAEDSKEPDAGDKINPDPFADDNAKKD